MQITHLTAATHSSATLKRRQPHQICISNTAGRKEWWVSQFRDRMAIFSHPSSFGTLLKGLTSPTPSPLSVYAQLRFNNPNSHSLQFPHLCLHTRFPYPYNYFVSCFPPQWRWDKQEFRLKRAFSLKKKKRYLHQYRYRSAII